MIPIVTTGKTENVRPQIRIVALILSLKNTVGSFRAMNGQDFVSFLAEQFSVGKM